MMKTYRSKFGIEMVIILSLVLGISAALMVLSKDWRGLIIIGIVIFFITYLFFATYYKLSKETLLVKSSFLYNLKIDVFSIRKIRETNLALSSPAFSLDRLEINYNQSDWVLISPKEKLEFINELKKLNPAIEVEYKKR